MTRIDLLAYLANTLGRMAAEARVKPLDQADGYKYVLDSAFRVLGVAEEDLPTATVGDAMTSVAQLLGHYYALHLFLDNVAPNQDMDGAQVRSRRTQPYTQITDRLVLVTNQLVNLGYGDALGLERGKTLRSYSLA